MRKLVLFLILLGLGLAVLAWLEEDTKPKADGEETRPPRADVPYRFDGGQGVSLGGAFTGRVYDRDTNRALLRVESKDSGTRGEQDIFVDVTLELLDPDTGKVQAVVKARRARLRRSGERPAFEPRHEPRVYLEDVEARFVAGLPVVPLTVKTANAIIDARDASRRTLSSDEPIEISSDSLVGGGLGFVSDIDGEVLEIPQQGWVEFRSEEDAAVRFSSLENGPLQIHREEGEEPRPMRIEAWEGARLEILDEEGSTLDATHIMARGVESGTGEEDETLRIRKLQADGDSVVWIYGENEFRGKRADIDFDENGDLLSARLEGPPTSAKLALETDAADISPVSPEDVSTLLVYGNDYIDITRDDRTNIDVDGPATVEAQGFRLRSNGKLSGWLALDGKSAHFSATGGVVLEGERATLETAEFELGLKSDADGRDSLSGLAKGGARLKGTLEDGREFSASTPDELEVLRLGESLRVVQGKRVEISVGGPDGYSARADDIRDVDLDTLAFTAEGNVELRSQDGIGRGDELVARGPEQYTLTGTAEKRARFENDEGWAEAVVVEADGDRLYARGNVEADLAAGTEAETLDEPAYQRYRLAGDELVLVRTDTKDEASDSSTRTFDLDVKGAVNARVRAGAETTQLTCERLIGTRVETFSGTGDARSSQTIDTRLEARGKVDGRVALESLEIDLTCDELVVTGSRKKGEKGHQHAVATGNVVFEGTSRIDFRGRGERLTLDSEKSGRLESPDSGRVQLAGILPSHGIPFRMTADYAEFQGENITASKPVIRIAGNRARGAMLEATPEELRLEGPARLSGTTKNFQPWTLDADNIRFRGRADVEESETELSAIDATGNVVFRLGALVAASGDSLVAERLTGTMTLTGSPARIASGVVEYEADWIKFDPELQIIRSTGRGRVRPGPDLRARTEGLEQALEPIKSFGPMPLQDQKQKVQVEEWGLEFLSSSTLVEPDSLVYVLQEPVFSYTLDGVDSTMRTSWTVLWIDRQGWIDLPQRLEEEKAAGIRHEPTREVAGPLGLFFYFLQKNGIEDLVREAYLEGPVEVLSGDDVVAHADAVYLDVEDGHGWLADATVNILGKLVGQDFEQITVKADWLRHSADGSLHADDATVTPCDFADPHAKIVTGDLRITPLPQNRFRLDVKENRVELYSLPAIPLPPISLDTDENLRPFWPSISIGNSARFGSFFGVNFSGSSKTVAKVAEKATRKKDRKFDANYDVKADWLGSRGGLLDIGMELKSKERYWFELWTGIVYDTGRDKGYIQVDEDDRDDLRLWLRGLNTVQLGKSRLTLVYNDQSDAGVQSEFWESEFVRYEQTETYLQWDRPSHNSYNQATAKVRADGFVADVEELPSASTFLGRAPLFDIAGYPVIHTGNARASNLRRREGSDPVSPFGLPATFPDGLGNREVVRVDTTQELEVPIPLGFGGLKLIPFTTVQAAAWDEAVDPDETASRVVAQAGLRLGTTFWKRSESGTLHSISPYVKYSNEVASEFNEEPVVFSPFEALVFGNLLEIGARARFGITQGRSGFDLDVKGTYISDRSDGADDGWLPISVFGRLDVSPFGQLLEIWHDARYDVEEGDTKYSLFAIGSRGGENLERIGWQVSHHRGRDFQSEPLFEALSVAGFYRWTDKWEFEGRQAFSLLEDQGLGFRVVLRRYGHDMIFEIETAYREGEGSSFEIDFSPRIGHSPSKVGYLRW